MAQELDVELKTPAMSSPCTFTRIMRIIQFRGMPLRRLLTSEQRLEALPCGLRKGQRQPDYLLLSLIQKFIGISGKTSLQMDLAIAPSYCRSPSAGRLASEP